jgi:hypothetical protein
VSGRTSIRLQCDRGEGRPGACIGLAFRQLITQSGHPDKIAVVLKRVMSEPQESGAREFLAQIKIKPLQPSVMERQGV